MKTNPIYKFERANLKMKLLFYTRFIGEQYKLYKESFIIWDSIVNIFIY